MITLVLVQKQYIANRVIFKFNAIFYFIFKKHKYLDKKDGLCPSSQVNLNSAKSCMEDVDCPDYDKCCPTSTGVNVCAKPCYKPKCSCKQTYVNQYTTNSKGCPMCHCVKRKLEKSTIEN